jgi:hypothetical protein
MTLAGMPRIAKKVMFSKYCSAVSIQLKRGASAGILKSIRIKLGPFIFLIDLDHVMFISH